jgi:hypothetical protein
MRLKYHALGTSRLFMATTKASKMQFKQMRLESHLWITKTFLLFIVERVFCNVCVPQNASGCGKLYCDFPIVVRPTCNFNWPSSGGARVAFMCDTSSLQGSCRACPPGWTASGAFCVECEALKSCDRNGTVACAGSCAPRRYPTCDSATGRVSCQECTVDEQGLVSSRRTITRGGVLDSPDLCSAYFKCYTGYYLATQGLTGELQCVPCEYPEFSGSGRRFVSRGLTFGDRFSCLYAPLQLKVNNNSMGEYGNPLRSCPVGSTSEPGMGANESDCVSCSMRPAFGTFGTESNTCSPRCLAGYILRGEVCVISDTSLEDCDSFDGYTLIQGKCTPTPLPWNSVGWESNNEKPVHVSNARGVSWSALDANGEFRVLSSTATLATQSEDNFCSQLMSVIENRAYVQDKPLFTKGCGDVESHKPYLLATGIKYLYVFLERSFGNNNRFVMWQVQKSRSGLFPAGQVWQTFRMPARACSAVVVPGDVVYIALCDSTFVSFAIQSDYMVTGIDVNNPPFVIEGTQYVLGRQLGILIGQEEAGNKDGMVPDALFRGPLSIATTSDSKRLLVADFGNCRIAEVAVHSPGSFLTRATTVGQSGCFSGEYPLPYPRNIVSVLGGAAALFVTDNGLIQLDARLRKFTVIMSVQDMRQAIGEPLWIRVESFGERLILENVTHTAIVTRSQMRCPGRQMSRRGGSCILCATGTFSMGAMCVPCSNIECLPGQRLVACNDTADARCEVCPNPSVSFSFRYGQNCQVIPRYPCPSGYYGLDDCLPCSIQMFRQWPAYAYCQCLGYSLGVNATCRISNPLPARPEWLNQLKCDYDLDVNCTFQACYLASVEPRACLPCTPGTFSADGLQCAQCPGFRMPSPARDACVCRSPSILSADGAHCVCPAGHLAGGVDGCKPCLPGTIKAMPTILSEDYQISNPGGQCSFCPPGNEPLPGNTACAPCPTGLYREFDMPSCQRCLVGISYATDPTRASSCVPCKSECHAGSRWAPCPVNSSHYSCEQCPSLQRYQYYVPGSRNCEWTCQVGFYAFNNQCYACTFLRCPPGFRFTPCSDYEDSHCRLPCIDSSKPEENSVWKHDCTWGCEEGYTQLLKKYPGWTEFACVKEDYSVPWSLSF